jgi:hypothetical protein
LIAAAPVEADIARTRAQAEAIRDSISAGTPIERFMANNAEVGLPEEVTLPLDQLGEQLPASYAQALRPARVGDVLGPITFLAGANQTVIAVASVTEVRQEGAFTYEDLREQIRTRLQEQRFVDRLYERLAAQTHVEVRW